jgi:hypothetical protein
VRITDSSRTSRHVRFVLPAQPVDATIMARVIHNRYRMAASSSVTEAQHAAISQRAQSEEAIRQRGPIWVKLRHACPKTQCPLYPQRPKRPCRANRANRRGRERLAYAAARRLAETLRLPSLSALAGPLVRPSAEGCGRVATVPFFLRRKAFCDSRLLLALCKSISAGGGSFIAN